MVAALFFLGNGAAIGLLAPPYRRHYGLGFLIRILAGPTWAYSGAGPACGHSS